MSISTVLLSYNEAENLNILIPKIKKELDSLNEEYEIIVVDTENKTDNTDEVCSKYGVKYINQEKPGFGGAFCTGIKYAKMDKFLILDSDGSHKPEYIPAMYNKFVKEDCDIVIGSRYTDGGETNDSKSSIVMSKILNFFFRLCLGINAKDISTDYRIYHTEQLKKVNIENRNYDVLQEVLLKLKQNKPDLKIREVPISFQKRVYGESKRQLIPFIIGYTKSLVRFTLIRYPLLKNLLLYMALGIIAFFLDFGLFFVLTKSLMKDSPELASLIGNIIGFIFTFTTNTYWNFKKSSKILLRAISYGTIVLLGVGISTVSIHCLKNIVSINALKLIVLMIVSILQFTLNKTITYSDKIK